MFDESFRILVLDLLNNQLVSGLVGGVVVLLLARQIKYWDWFNQQAWFNQKLVERRLEIYTDTMPLYNKLYCYVRQVGAWKESNPSEIIKLKRDLDAKIYVADALFRKNFHKVHRGFMQECFRIRTGIGKDAKLRVDPENYRIVFIEGKTEEGKTEREKEWKQLGYDDLFASKEERSKKENIDKAYRKLIDGFRHELGLN